MCLKTVSKVSKNILYKPFFYVCLFVLFLLWVFLIFFFFFIFVGFGFGFPLVSFCFFKIIYLKYTSSAHMNSAFVVTYFSYP